MRAVTLMAWLSFLAIAGGGSVNTATAIGDTAPVGVLARANDADAPLHAFALRGNVAGCVMAGCNPAGTRVVNLNLPSRQPSVVWTWRARKDATFADAFSTTPVTTLAGCVSNFDAVRCAVPLYRENKTWSGLLGLSALDGSETFTFDGVSTVHCDSDDSWAGVGANLPLLSVRGDAVLFSNDGVALVENSGIPAWAEAMQPQKPCAAPPSSPSFTNSSLPAFVYIVGAEVFGART